MSRPGFRFGAWSCVVLAVAAGFWGCGTSAAGADECRAIEYARCSAARYCDVGLDTASDLTECNHFARDNCLHGVASGQAPRSSDVDHCVAAINASGTCAHRHGSDLLASDCTALQGSVATDRTTVCDVVKDPENSSECGFLTDKPVSNEPKDSGSD